MGVVSSLASVLGINETTAPVTAAIAELDPKTGQEKLGNNAANSPTDPFQSDAIRDSLQAFQYFPETIQDTKAPEWVRKNVPGGSHPILTFLNGGERVISFPAVFTQDDNPEPIGAFSAALTGSFDFGVQDLFGDGVRKDSVGKEKGGIPSAIAFLRKFTYPTYPNDIATPPPFSIVYLPNSGIIGGGQFADSIVGAMVQCNVSYEKFHRNGTPRIVVVSLAFVEVVQTGENWKFVGAETFKDQAGRYTREVIGADPGDPGLLDLLF